MSPLFRPSLELVQGSRTSPGLFKSVTPECPFRSCGCRPFEPPILKGTFNLMTDSYNFVFVFVHLSVGTLLGELKTIQYKCKYMKG